MNARPPADPGAERRLISVVCSVPGLFQHAADVQPSDFYDLARREAWARLAADCQAGAPVMLADYIEHYEADTVPVSAYVIEDARRVKEMRYRRDALIVAQNVAKAALTGDGLPDALRQAAEVKSGTVSGTLRPIGDYVSDVRDVLETPDHMAALVVKTGMTDLDRMMGGGLERKTETVIMARPSMGKTALMVQLADAASEAGLVVAVFSKEMVSGQWARRMACRRARVNWNAVKEDRASDADLRRLAQELAAIEERRTLYIDESRPQTTDEAYRELERLADRVGRVDLVLADHMRLFADRADNETHRMGKIGWQFKIMSVNLNCAVIVAAQLSRAVEGQSDKRPDLKDLRDSGEIEENADNVLALYRDAYYMPGVDDVAEIISRKARDGQRNTGARYLFKPEYMGFELLERQTNDTRPTQGATNHNGTARRPAAAGYRPSYPND